MAKLHSLLICAVFIGPFCDACIGFGGCGFGGLCCFAPILGCGCLRYCHRAKGSKTLEVDGPGQLGEERGGSDVSHSYSSPDEEFFECCKERGLPPACLDKCSYASYSADTLRNMFLRMDECPVRAANDLHMCATRGRDHRLCCNENGVTDTFAGEKCLLFCQRPPENQTELDLSYLPCYDRFDTMRDCFWEDAVRDYEVRFRERESYEAMLDRYSDF